MIILLDGKEYAVGLNWFAISSEEEVGQFQREMDMQYGVMKLVKKEGEQSTVALCGPEYADQLSLAGILSYAYKNLLFVTSTAVKNEAGEPLFYLCAVKNGVVTVDGDTLGNADLIQSVYQQSLGELSSEIPLEEIERFCCGVDEAAYPDLNPVKLSAVLEPAQRFASACLIKTIAKKNLSMVSVAMVSIGFIVGGYFMFAWVFQEPPPPPMPTETVQVVVAPKEDPFDAFMQAFTQTLKSQPRATVVSEFVNTVKTMPMQIQGWQMTDIIYSGGGTQITVRLKRNPYASVDELTKAVSTTQFTSVNVDADLNNATSSFPINPATDFIDVAMIKALKGNTKANNLNNMASQLQRANLAFQYTNDTSISYFASNQFTLTGDGLWNLERMGTMLSSIPTLGIKTIAVKYNNGQYSWTLGGMVYG